MMQNEQTVWVRVCQECGTTNICTAPPPDKELSDAYRNKPCRRCGSAGLDYGRWEETEVPT